MRVRNLISIVLVAFILPVGCTKAEVPEETFKEVRPGVYLSDDLSDFPFPTSGYDLYLVGETHGNRETKIVFRTFLELLYQESDLRDVILEEDQAYETDANAYVHGLTDELVEGLCLRTDILGQIREFNTDLPENQKVNIHLVDVDSPMPTIYKHLVQLHQELGPGAENITLPNFSDFNTSVPQQRSDLMEDLKQAAAGQSDILDELESISLSLQWYNLGNRMHTGMPSGRAKYFAPLREDILTKNIRSVLSQLNGKPILAFFGYGHGLKAQAGLTYPAGDIKSWAQRLSEDGINLYSLAIMGATGEGYWRGDAFEYEVQGNQQYSGVAEIRFDDGTPLISLFEPALGFHILFADLRAEENGNIQFPPDSFPDLPAGQLFDGLVIYKDFTPMENSCPP